MSTYDDRLDVAPEILADPDDNPYEQPFSPAPDEPTLEDADRRGRRDVIAHDPTIGAPR